MESFEITFFCHKGNYDKKSIGIIDEKYKCFDSIDNKSIVEFFSEKEKDFDEFRISIFHFKLTKDKFIYTFENLSKFVGSIFCKMKGVIFATGIYEITYYLTESKKKIVEFDNEFLQKFPIVFYKTREEPDSGKIIYSDENIFCVFYEGAQNLY